MFENPSRNKKENPMPHMRDFAKLAVVAGVLAFQGNPVHAEVKTPEQKVESVFKGFGITSFNDPAVVDAYNVEVPSDSDKYIFQIDQIHAGVGVSDTDSIKETIDTHKNIEKIINQTLSANPNAAICGESIHNIDEKLAEWDEEKRDIQKLSELTERFVQSGEYKNAYEEYEKWNEFFTKYSFPGYAQKMRLYGAVAISRQLPQSPEAEVVKKLMETVNQFGEDALYYGGALQYMYKIGKLNKAQFFNCENAQAFSNVGSALEKLRATSSNGEVEDMTEVNKLMEIREDFMLKNIDRKLADDNTKLVVMVMGAYHDLTNNIQSLNDSGKDIGYMYVTPHPLGSIDLSINQTE